MPWEVEFPWDDESCHTHIRSLCTKFQVFRTLLLGDSASRQPDFFTQAGAQSEGGKRFRGGLVFEAHRLLHHSTLGLRVIKKKMKEAPAFGFQLPGFVFRLSGFGFQVQGHLYGGGPVLWVMDFWMTHLQACE